MAIQMSVCTLPCVGNMRPKLRTMRGFRGAEPRAGVARRTGCRVVASKDANVHTRPVRPATVAAALGAAALTAGGCEAALAVSTLDPVHMAVLGELDPASAKAMASFLRPVLSIGSLLMIVRIVMTWFPEVKDTEWPWLAAYLPTEPVLAPTRKIIQPVGGVDVSPIVWVAAISFFNEILLGPQGLLILLSQKVQ